MIKSTIKTIIGNTNSIRIKRILSRVFWGGQVGGSHQEHSNSILFRFSETNKNVFFGYYDVSPFNADSSKILASQANLFFSSPSSKDILQIGYYQLTSENPVFQKLAETTTWCWQQGCRLQWFPGECESVFYNTAIDGQYGSVVQDVLSKEIITQFNEPLYAISPNGAYGLALDFSRLQRLRPGYGYSNFEEKEKKHTAPFDNGIFLINLNSGGKTLVHSLGTIAEISPHGSMNGAEHYFNHLYFNPSGTRFLFFHLWVNKAKRYSRLFTSDLDGQNLCLLNNDGPVSHYNWKSDEELLVFGKHQDSGFGYYLYQDMSGQRTQLGKGILTEDGHPTFFSKDGTQYILTDTYPDKTGYQKLLAYDMVNDRYKTLGKHYSPARFNGETRCDLHPRINQSCNIVCIDSAEKNKREMIVIKVQH